MELTKTAFQTRLKDNTEKMAHLEAAPPDLNFILRALV